MHDRQGRTLFAFPNGTVAGCFHGRFMSDPWRTHMGYLQQSHGDPMSNPCATHEHLKTQARPMGQHHKPMGFSWISSPMGGFPLIWVPALITHAWGTHGRPMGDIWAIPIMGVPWVTHGPALNPWELHGRPIHGPKLNTHGRPMGQLYIPPGDAWATHG